MTDYSKSQPDSLRNHVGDLRLIEESDGLLRAALLLGVSALGLVVLQFTGTPDAILNTISPFVVLVVLGHRLVSWIRDSTLAVWSTAFWFLVPCIPYYGLGPLVYVFGTPESIGHLDSFYFVDSSRLFRTNVLNLVCISVTFLFAGMALRPFRKSFAFQFAPANPGHLRRAAVIMLTVGLPIKYLLVVPSSIGLLTASIPNWLQFLAYFATLAIVPLFWANRLQRRPPSLPLVALIGAEFVSSFMTFSKLDVIRVLIIVIIALSMGRRQLRTVLVGGVAVALFYSMFLSSYIGFMRIEYGFHGTADLSVLRSGYASYSAGGKEEIADSLPGVQGWWTRFAYPNAQAFCMDTFDSGANGFSFELIVPSLLPRVLFPNKPDITIGDQFNQLVTGNAMSKSACGVFGEAYWNGGWTAAILTSAYLGAFIAFFCLYARWVLTGHRVLFLPSLWIGISASLQPDSWFAATFVGPLATFVFYHLIIQWLMQPAFEGRFSLRA